VHNLQAVISYGMVPNEHNVSLFVIWVKSNPTAHSSKHCSTCIYKNNNVVLMVLHCCESLRNLHITEDSQDWKMFPGKHEELDQ
jgi:hypothetical protein